MIYNESNTDFQRGVMIGIEAANFKTDVITPEDIDELDLFNQGVAYGYGIHQIVMGGLTNG